MSTEPLATMNSKFELKDPLYYDDLIYVIFETMMFKFWHTNLNIDDPEDKIKYERISLRLEPENIKHESQENKIQGEEPTDFLLDLFLIVKRISKMARVQFKSIEAISEYPELVQKVLVELNQKNKDNKLLNYLVAIIKSIGLENEFSLGQDAEQRVCLNRSNNSWEVYIVERGISFEKSVYEDCFDACVEVINQLADSKQMYEDAKEKLGMVRKLVPNK